MPAFKNILLVWEGCYECYTKLLLWFHVNNCYKIKVIHFTATACLLSIYCRFITGICPAEFAGNFTANGGCAKAPPSVDESAYITLTQTNKYTLCYPLFLVVFSSNLAHYVVTQGLTGETTEFSGRHSYFLKSHLERGFCRNSSLLAEQCFTKWVARETNNYFL